MSKSINDLRKNKTEIEKLTKCTCGECKTERVSVKEDQLNTGRPPEHWKKKKVQGKENTVRIKKNVFGEEDLGTVIMTIPPGPIPKKSEIQT